MRLLIYADPHWSTTSSIIRSRGEKYSRRLEGLIKTMQWIENLAVEENCSSIVCLGDFFDTATLNSEEISALHEIAWSNKYHYFIVGNHEIGKYDLSLNSVNALGLADKFDIIDRPAEIPIWKKDTAVICVPYILDKDRKPLKEYLLQACPHIDDREHVIVFSHNDIKGVQMGRFISTSGFELSEIKDNCSLFVNGHLHNGCEVAPGVINLGNITGQNFVVDGGRTLGPGWR